MTKAVCIRCGEFKHGTWSACSRCRHQPFGVPDLAWSIFLSDHHFSSETLNDLSRHIAEYGKPPVTEDEDFNKVYQDCEDSILASYASLSKRGLLPPREQAPSENPPIDEDRCMEALYSSQHLAFRAAIAMLSRLKGTKDLSWLDELHRISRRKAKEELEADFSDDLRIVQYALQMHDEGIEAIRDGLANNPHDPI